MSAPSTDVEKQSKRHRPAMWGISIVLGMTALLFLAYIANLSAQGNQPGETPAAIAES